MAGQSSSQAATPFQWWKPALFFLVVIFGLWYVKWQPYYGKAFTAAETHSIGQSILARAATNPWRAAWDYAMVYFIAVWKAAVLGVLLGSLIQVLIPRDWLRRTLGASRFRGTLFGTLFSLPGMMCTCCAAPVAAGMRRRQASMGGALAFWMGNPLLNPATLVFMGFVLGWHFAAIRLIAGLAMVLVVATLVQTWVQETPQPIMPVALAEPEPQGGFFARWGKALWALFWSTIPVYILAVLVLGAARVWLFPHADGAMDNSLMWVIAMAVAGCLFVIPTAAEIPIVQTLMLAGMGTAPALALLMTLPAISLPSLIMLRSAFPVKALWLTGGLVAIAGMIVGSLALV
ncbi:permease [Salmonella bongori]|uniref:permease n=1 Tax=Salmonella bongori TaxID=54736 RepID=UPI0009A97D85|nr:permease [Salmonella bongori]EDP8627604.1 permease [Salmonella bongori]EDP8657990.1 permease [Salmonella bongori]EEU7166070.1 permease [Salmonella bongori]EIU0393996.1 permease [Salmonella bongori]